MGEVPKKDPLHSRKSGDNPPALGHLLPSLAESRQFHPDLNLTLNAAPPSFESSNRS